MGGPQAEPKQDDQTSAAAGRISLGAVQGRISDMSSGGMIGAGLLADAVGQKIGQFPALYGKPSAPKKAHWTYDLAEAAPLIEDAVRHTERAFAQKRFPVLFLGECATSLGTAAAIQRHSPTARIIWFDAHGDFNTPETTVTSYLGGITLTGASGYWHTGFGGEMRPAQLVLVGARDLDPPEAELLSLAGAIVLKPGPRLLEQVIEAVGSDPIWIHIDCDVLDPSEFEGIDPEYHVPGGLSLAELGSIVARLAERKDVIGLEVAEFEAPQGELARTRAVDALVKIIDPIINLFQAA